MLLMCNMVIWNIYTSRNDSINLLGINTATMLIIYLWWQSTVSSNVLSLKILSLSLVPFLHKRYLDPKLSLSLSRFIYFHWKAELQRDTGRDRELSAGSLPSSHNGWGGLTQARATSPEFLFFLIWNFFY